VKTYARLWLCWWGVLGAMGLLLGVKALPVLTVVGVSLGAGVAVGALSFVIVATHCDGRLSTVEQALHAGQRVPLGALVAVTILATSIPTGPLIWPVLALVAVTSPWMITCGRRLGWRRQSAPDREPTPRPSSARACMQAADWASAVWALSDEQLCASWGTSYTAMQTALVADCVELAALRHAYLEELERRNPEGLRAWFDSGATAAGNPATYLAEGRPQ
jgi:hypothetical protein